MTFANRMFTSAMAEMTSSYRGYEIAIFVLVPLLVLVLCAVVVYVLCSRKYKLNWYDKTMLEAGPGQDPEDEKRVFIKRKVFTNKLGSVNSSCEVNDQFWVPTKQLSYTDRSDFGESEDDHSQPITPNTPLGIKVPSFHLAAERLSQRTVQPPSSPGASSGESSPRLSRGRFASMHAKLDHTKINRDMYKKGVLTKTTDSQGSIPEEILGSMHMTLSFNREISLLTVHFLQIQNLSAKDITRAPNPYCKLTIGPERRQQVQSKTQQRTFNPEFNEEFLLEVSDIESSLLEVEVFDFDPCCKHDCFGVVTVPLRDLNLCEPLTVSTGITAPIDTAPNNCSLGELQFSISYLTSAERLTLVIMRTRYMKIDGKSSDLYVKVSLLRGGKRLKKKKTSTKRNTPNPAFHEALVFSVSKELLSNLTIELMVINENLLGNNEVMGRIILSSESKGLELEHWLDVVNIRNATGRWHSLV
ncbi:PREDICTED: synaptotagmin-5-like isoform X1 [Priapulus caudatus]|uniref:Synaptotagmin-5-like isoform X1 n=1 Tax=Priapulus caudatus TaxID=37621 RepID=A0ABM1DNJ7_PRICU|nr:PREDICTED: synaptotagmin-5-like isoform X1 [Priapulus caudatus]